jgi:hypothetical protein
MSFSIRSKRAQAWGTDLVIAVSIFSLALTAVYFYSINDSRSPEEKFESLFYDGGKISDSLLSEGYPDNWNSGSVSQIGLLSDGKIDPDKLEEFYLLANSEYSRTKSLFNTRYDYYFFMEEPMIIDGVSVEGIGKPGFNRYSTDSQNLIKITRVVVYNNSVTSAYFYVFEDG